MTSAELPLAGGNASSFVVRVGETVRKPWSRSSESVQRLLKHLRAAVGDLVPEPYGRDAEGRQILEFVPGIEAMTQLPITATDAERVGAGIRALHDASAAFARSDADVWETAMHRPGDEIIGHNDLAPWNLIRSGERWAFIDWDGAGPTTRIADLAYAARAFAQLDRENEPDESILLLRAVLSGYGASPEERADLVPAMIERTEAMRDLLAEGRASGVEPWASMAVDGHEDYWSNAASYVRRHRETIARAVR